MKTEKEICGALALLKIAMVEAENLQTKNDIQLVADGLRWVLGEESLVSYLLKNLNEQSRKNAVR